MKIKLIAVLALILAASFIGGWKWASPKVSPTRSAAPSSWAQHGPTVSPSGWSWGEDAE